MTEQHVEDRDSPLGKAALAPMPPPSDLSLVMDPEQSLSDASRAARTLVKMVKEQGLSHRFGGRGGKEHLMIEAWQTIATWYGVTVSIDYCYLKNEGEGFEARAVAVTPTGREVGAIAYCTRDEGNWKSKPAFQLASMAQTRACSKALRLCLGWVAVVAGYSATPAEEMEREAPPDRPAPQRQQAPPASGWPTEETVLDTLAKSNAPVTEPMFGRNEFVQAYKDAGKTIEDVKEVLGGLDPMEWLDANQQSNFRDAWALCAAKWGVE